MRVNRKISGLNKARSSKNRNYDIVKQSVGVYPYSVFFSLVVNVLSEEVSNKSKIMIVKILVKVKNEDKISIMVK